jgi:hypothetical protein
MVSPCSLILACGANFHRTCVASLLKLPAAAPAGNRELCLADGSHRLIAASIGLRID